MAKRKLEFIVMEDSLKKDKKYIRFKVEFMFTASTVGETKKYQIKRKGKHDLSLEEATKLFLKRKLDYFIFSKNGHRLHRTNTIEKMIEKSICYKLYITKK